MLGVLARTTSALMNTGQIGDRGGCESRILNTHGRQAVLIPIGLILGINPIDVAGFISIKISNKFYQLPPSSPMTNHGRALI